jgi:hypothetical protein
MKKKEPFSIHGREKKNQKKFEGYSLKTIFILFYFLKKKGKTNFIPILGRRTF